VESQAGLLVVVGRSANGAGEAHAAIIAATPESRGGILSLAAGCLTNFAVVPPALHVGFTMAASRERKLQEVLPGGGCEGTTPTYEGKFGWDKQRPQRAATPGHRPSLGRPLRSEQAKRRAGRAAIGGAASGHGTTAHQVSPLAPRPSPHRPYGASNMNSTSTGTPKGSSATPMAMRAWRPASPKTSSSTCEAPLMTFGWSVKPSAPAT